MLYRFGLILSTVGSTLIYHPSLVDCFGFLKIIPALVGVLIMWPWCAPSRFRQTGIDLPLAACAAAFIASLIWSVDPLLGIMGVHTQPFHGAVAMIPAVLVFYAACSRNEHRPHLALEAAGAVALIQGVVCAAQLGGLVEHPFDTIGGRALGTMGSPVFLGGLLAPCIPAAVWLAARGGAFGWAAAAAGFLAVAATWSRGPWISALVGLGGYLAASGRIRPRRAHFVALGLILAALAAISEASGKMESDRGRLGTWKVAYIAAIEHPVLGWGPDTFPLAMRQHPDRGTAIQASAHNDLLQAWATTGIVGLFAYGWLWAALLVGAWRSARWGLDDSSAAIFGSLVALFVAAKFNPIPPSAIYIAAALAGTALSSFPIRAHMPMRRTLWGLGLAAILAAGAVSWPKIKAEFYNSYGILAVQSGDLKRGANLLRLGNEAFPSEVAYSSSRCRMILDLIKVSEKPRNDFMRLALRSAAAVVKSHPNDPSSHELMASVEMFGASIFGEGLFRSAVRSSRKAAELSHINK